MSHQTSGSTVTAIMATLYKYYLINLHVPDMTIGQASTCLVTVQSSHRFHYFAVRVADTYMYMMYCPSKHKALVQCWADV